MAAPAPTVRVQPTGIYLQDGFPTKITFSLNTSINLWEKTAKPPGVDGGDPVDTSTFWNTAWRTKAPRILKDLQEATFTAAYDPVVYTDAVALVNVRKSGNSAQVITYTFPDGSTLAFFGYLKQFEMNDLSDGEMPEATVTIVPTNYDPVNNVESAPVMTSVAGT